MSFTVKTVLSIGRAESKPYRGKDMLSERLKLHEKLQEALALSPSPICSRSPLWQARQQKDRLSKKLLKQEQRASSLREFRSGKCERRM